VVPTLRDAGTQHTAFVAHPLFGAAQGQTQRRHLRTADVAQFDPLEIIPQAFDGIEVGGVGWQLLQMQPLGRFPSKEVLDGLAAMNRRSIPNNQQFPGNLAQEYPQEAHNIRTAIGVILGLQEESPIWGEAADGSHMVMGQRYRQERRLPMRRPGPHRHR